MIFIQCSEYYAGNNDLFRLENFIYSNNIFSCWLMFCIQAKPEDTLDLCQIINNDLAKTVEKYPKRFVGLGTLPMQAPDLAVKELIRCKTDLG